MNRANKRPHGVLVTGASRGIGLEFVRQDEQDEWLHAPPDRTEAIQARVLPAEVLEIVPDNEAEQYTGRYLK